MEKESSWETNIRLHRPEAKRFGNIKGRVYLNAILIYVHHFLKRGKERQDLEGERKRRRRKVARRKTKGGIMGTNTSSINSHLI